MDSNAATPRNDRAERAVLGSCLIDPNAIFMTKDLEPGHFLDEKNGKIFEAMQRIASGGSAIDPFTVSGVMGDGFLSTLTEMVAETPTSYHAEHYAQLVRTTALRRQLAQAAAQIMRLAHDMDVEHPVQEAQARLAGLIDADQANGLVDGSRFWNNYIEQYATRTDASRGIATGFSDLDRLIGGLEPEKLYILAARPGMGKSILAQQIAESALYQAKHVLYVSLEMGCTELADRIIIRKTGLSNEQIKAGKSLEKITRLAGQKAGERIHYLDDANLTTLAIRAHLQRLKATGDPVDLLVLDYAQLCQDGNESMPEYQQQTLISKRLNALKKEFGIPVLAVAQLSRQVESRTNKRPQLNDLRSTGQYEQDADVVAFLYRDAYYDENFSEVGDTSPHVAEIIIAKQRGGPTGNVPVTFVPRAVSFVGREYREERI